MQLESFCYRANTGWSVREFPSLDSQDTLVLVFGAKRFQGEERPLAELLRAFPRSHVVGCSTAGEIFGTQVNDDSLSVAVMHLEHGSVRTAVRNVAGPTASFQVGADLGTELIDDELRGLFVLSDGLLVNGSELVRGFSSTLPDGVPLTGGLAGDGPRFESTWIARGDQPRSGLVAAVGLYGERVRVGHGSKGGWDIFGPERRVTRSKDNVLYELDGRPALALYKEYLGERASGLPATGLLFPLALRKSANDKTPVVRTILAVDDATQSMTFAGDIPEGHLAQLMRANFDRLVDGALGAAQMVKPGAEGDVLAIAISCVGRRLVLGERIEEEVEATLHELPKGTQQVGFYSYGEISPYASGGCDLHNQTMTLTTISED
jgi:hypothetical protein